MGNKKPFMLDTNLLEQTGILNLYKKCVSENKIDLKDKMRIIMRVVDETDAIGRYEWGDIPTVISSNECERLLYYRGRLALFYLIETDKFYLMPYTGHGLDFYGRFANLTPVPICTEDENPEAYNILKNKSFKAIYDLKDITEDIDPKQCAVVLFDYMPQLATNNIIPRYQLNDALLDVESEIIPLARTARILASGIKGMRVDTEEAADNVEDANRKLEEAALTGKGYVPITGSVEFQELEAGNTQNSEEYMLALQSLENFRLSTYGIPNNGVYEKKSHMLEGEQAINGGPTQGRLERGLELRQLFAELANELFKGLLEKPISVKIKDSMQEEPTEGGMENEDDSSGQHDDVQSDIQE